MQLGEAIARWLAEHSQGLSTETLDGIDAISSAIDKADLRDVEHHELTDPERDAIVATATVNTTLDDGAINEFLDIVVAWAGRHHHETPTDESGDLEPSPPAANNLDQDPDNLAGVEEEDLDPDNLAGVDEEDLDPDELDAIDHDLAAVDEARADEEDQDPDNLAGVDEEDLDPDELDAIDHDLAAVDEARVDDISSTDELEVISPEVAASSFFQTIGQTLAPEDQVKSASDSESTPADPSTKGIFSQAAEEPIKRPTDWISIAWFSIAFVCFVFVIILYLAN